MSRTAFENFGRLAKISDDQAEIAGRYSFQGIAEPLIVQDVAKKLCLDRSDTLLEIGCGAGNLLVPLSGLVAQATGIDHADLLTRLQQRSPAIRALPGNFLDVDAGGPFSKVLIYSVLHYLSDAEETRRFVLKAASLVAPDGILMIGDIPNADKKRAFEASEKGQEVLREWRTKTAGQQVRLGPDDKLVAIDDKVLADLTHVLTEQGFHVTRHDQPDGLPFCHTRQDLVAEKRR